MIEILYIITMYITLRSFERVEQVFNSSSIHSQAKHASRQRVAAQYQRRKFSSNKSAPGGQVLGHARQSL